LPGQVAHSLAAPIMADVDLMHQQQQPPPVVRYDAQGLPQSLVMPPGGVAVRSGQSCPDRPVESGPSSAGSVSRVGDAGLYADVQEQRPTVFVRDVPQPLRPPCPPRQHALVCTFAHGCDVDSLADEAKQITWPYEEKVTIGRKEQPGFFEALLGNSQDFLRFVSRSHFVLIPCQPGHFSVKNLSRNAFLVNGQRLANNEQGAIGPGSSIDFIVEQPPPSTAPPAVFLRLCLPDREASEADALPQARRGGS